MKAPLLNKQRVEKQTLKSWALIVLLVILALFCLTSGEVRVNDEVQFGTKPGSAPAAAPSDSSGASTSTARTSSNPPNSASTSGSQSNPASGPPQQFTHMSTRSMHRSSISKGRENMAIRSAGPLPNLPTEPSASSHTFRSAGPLPETPIEPSASSHTFPAVSRSSVPPAQSSEREALEGLLHINLPSSLGQQQQTEQGEQETVVILDAEEAKRGPGHRTDVGEFKRNESAARADDVRDVLDLVLAMTIPRAREVIETYDKRVLKAVKEALQQKGLSLKFSIQQRNWWIEKVKFAYDMHKGAGPSTLTKD